LAKRHPLLRDDGAIRFAIAPYVISRGLAQKIFNPNPWPLDPGSSRADARLSGTRKWRPANRQRHVFGSAPRSGLRSAAFGVQGTPGGGAATRFGATQEMFLSVVMPV
jgi:hypothetical protein